jgi:hypothetical protein
MYVNSVFDSLYYCRQVAGSYNINILLLPTFEMLYRVNTKELYTFKMVQKTNAAYLELHTYTSQ